MLILLEGPDGSGKTTAAEQLAELLERRFPDEQVTLLHKGPPTTRNWLDEYLEPLATYEPGAGQHLILDRWHWGEQVYPKLWDRPSLFTHSSEWWYLEAFLRSRGALVIRFDGSAEFHAERVVARAIREGKAETFNLLVLTAELSAQAMLFDRAAELSHLDQMVLFSGPPLSQALGTVLNHAANLERAASFLVREHRTYVGPAKPSYLILGDRRGPGRRDIPVAFAPLRGTSGYFLLRSLPEAWLTCTEVGIANACEDPDLDGLLDQLGHPKVIALGRGAADATRHLKRATMPHPQFVRRFLHAAQRRYGEAIVEALEEQKEMLTWRP